MSDQTKRKPPDWEAIEREYRAGQLSVREIARAHEISHVAISKRAKADGWERDLTEKVQKAVKQRVVTSAVTTRPSREEVVTEREIISAAADRGARAIQGHLARAGEMAALAELLLAKLRRAIASEEAFPKELLLGKGDGLASLLRAAGDMAEKSTNMERRALNLDDNKGEEEIGLILKPKW